jgi:hypothetical protein
MDKYSNFSIFLATNILPYYICNIKTKGKEMDKRINIDITAAQMPGMNLPEVAGGLFLAESHSIYLSVSTRISCQAQLRCSICECCCRCCMPMC